MTLLQRQQYDEIDQDRRRKEESLLLLLLLLCEEARHAAIHAAVIGASVSDAIRAVLTNGGMPALLKAGADDAYTSAVAMAGQLVPEIPPVPPSAPPDTYVGQVDPNALVDAIVHRVAKGLADGEALTATSIGDAFDAAGVTIDNPYLLDGAAETQVNAGYQLGLFFGWVADPNVTGLEYVSVIDDGTTKICRRRNGVKLPKDDPWWLENVPPMHYGCRSTLLPLTGPFTVTINPPTFPPAQPSFGLAPFGLVTRQPALAASRLEAPTLNLSTDDEGEWRTINGVHVMIDKDGIVRKGPANLVGMHHGQIKASGAEPDIAANHAAAVARVRARKLPGQASAYGQAVQHGLFGQGALEHPQGSLFVGAGESGSASRSAGKKVGASAPLFGETASTGAQGHLFPGKPSEPPALESAHGQALEKVAANGPLPEISNAHEMDPDTYRHQVQQQAGRRVSPMEADAAHERIVNDAISSGEEVPDHIRAHYGHPRADEGPGRTAPMPTEEQIAKARDEFGGNSPVSAPSAPVDPSRQFGLFAKDASGQPAEIGEKAGQSDLFNRGKYKLTAPASEPTREVVGSANANDPKHTAEMFADAPKMESEHGKALNAAAQREPMADARGTGGGQANPNNEVSWTSKSGKKFKVEVGDNQLNVSVDGKHLGSAFPHNLKSADHPENASLRSALLASGNTHAIVSGKMGIGVPANEAAKIQSAIAEVEAGNSVPREHQRLKDALGTANDRLKDARERAHQSDGVGPDWHHAKASEQAADTARSALRDFESTHNLSRGSAPTLNLDRAEEGDGHWVTIEDAHVFIGKGGTIEKGPAHLTGKKIGDLPPRSKAMDASDHHHAARESMRKAGIAQSAGDYKGAQRHANNALKHSQASNELKEKNGGLERTGKSAAPSRPTLQSAHGQSLEQHTAGPVPVDQEVAAAAKSGKLQAPVDASGKINPHLAEAYARHAERQGLKLGEFETRDGVATASVTRQNAPSEPPEMQSDHGKMLADTQAALVSLGVKRAEAKQLAEKAEGATASERTANALRLREGTSKHSVSSPKPAAPTTSEPGNEKSQEQHRSEADERINSLKKSLPGIGEHLQNRPVTATFHSGEVFDPNGNPAQGLYHRSPADGDSIDIATGADFSKTKGKNLAQNPSDSFVHEIGHHLQSQIGKTSDPGNREWQDIYESKLPDEWAQSVSPYGGSKAAELFSESLLKKSDPGRFGSLPPEIDAYLNKHLGSKSVAAPSAQPSQSSSAGQANAKATNGAKAPKVGKDTTRSAMEKELVDHHEKVSGAGTYSADDEQWINSHSAGDPFKYHGEMPGEIKGMIADNPALRNKFSRTENRKEAGFEDAYGADPKRYEAIANSIAGNPLKAAIETAKKSNDPMMPLKAAILETTPPSASALQAAATRAKAGLKNVAPEHRAKAEANVRAMQERAQHAKSEAVGKEHVLPEHLQQGDTFKINGHPVTVTVDEDEHEILQDHGTIPDTPIEAIRGMKLPIDKGSLKHEAASAPVHQHDDSIPFSRVFAPRPLELILSA